MGSVSYHFDFPEMFDAAARDVFEKIKISAE